MRLVLLACGGPGVGAGDVADCGLLKETALVSPRQEVREGRVGGMKGKGKGKDEPQLRP